LRKRLFLLAALCCLLALAGCRYIEVVDAPAQSPVATVAPAPEETLAPTPAGAPVSTPAGTPTAAPSPADTQMPTSQLVQADTLPIYSVQREEKVVALTFDASWGATYTQKLLDTLDAYDARATFFLVGFWVDEHPELTAEIVERGHAVGNHSENHLNMSELTEAEVASELLACQDKIDALVGRPDTLIFRPPYGDYDDDMLRVCAEEGFYAIQWDVDSWDWKDITAAEIEERVLSRVGPGSIVLMHNEGQHTWEALPAILEELKTQGYSFVTVPELIYKDHYRIDRNGRQQPE
jgi:polysaccharide deacetylase family sporulation protein PdaB